MSKKDARHRRARATLAPRMCGRLDMAATLSELKSVTITPEDVNTPRCTNSSIVRSMGLMGTRNLDRSMVKGETTTPGTVDRTMTMIMRRSRRSRGRKKRNA